MNNYLNIRAQRIRRNLKYWFSLKRNQRRATLIGIGLLAAIFFFAWAITVTHASEEHYLLIQRQNKLSQLHTQLLKVQKEKAVTDTELKQKAADEASLNAKIDDLNKQLQAKKQSELAAQQAAVNIASANQIPQTNLLPQAGAVISGCGDNSYANFIYMHESGCNTGAVNPGGCFGIGQACPGSKLAYCGTDYACQNAFFTAYASKYGGWAGSYSFWVSHGWW